MSSCEGESGQGSATGDERLGRGGGEKPREVATVGTRHLDIFGRVERRQDGDADDDVVRKRHYAVRDKDVRNHLLLVV